MESQQGLDKPVPQLHQAAPNSQTSNDVAAPSRSNSNLGSNNKSKYKKPFFAVPIVGFFDQRNRKSKAPKKKNDRAVNGESESLLPLQHRSSSMYTVSFSDDTEDNSSSRRPNQEKRSGKDLWDILRSYRPPKRKPRSGKELWSILRYHVKHESFHIHYQFKDTIRRKHDSIQFNEDVNIPYDFTVTHCFVALVVYLVISIIAYSFVFENWTMIDSMYFACVTFTTIGYGDLCPTTHGGRLFASFFALSGVAILAIGLGVVGSKIIESQVSHIAKAEEHLASDVLRVFKPPRTAKEKQTLYLSKSEGSGGSSSFAYLDACDDPSSSLHDELEDAVHPWHSFLDGCRFFCKMLLRYIPSLAPLFLGSYLIGTYEGWTWDDCIYYCVVTTTTIGFGDYTPDRQILRAFAVVFIPLSVGAMGHFLGTIANFIVDQRSKYFDKQLWRHELTLEDLHAMSKGQDDTVTELDFVVFMLKAMKKVDEELVEKIREHFRRLDLSGNGILDREDLEIMAKKKLRGTKSKLRLHHYKQRLEAVGSASFCSEEEHERRRRAIHV